MHIKASETLQGTHQIYIYKGQTTFIHVKYHFPIHQIEVDADLHVDLMLD